MKNGKYTGEKLNQPYIKYAWFKDDLKHREDGPAVEWKNGDKFWYINGKWHRLDGPAVEWKSGHKNWYYHDEYIECQSQEEFKRFIKLLAFK